MTNWNAQRYAVHTARHDELTDFVRTRTAEILKILEPDKQAWLEEFDSYSVKYEYRHYYDEYRIESFPAEWLFAEDWKEQVTKVVQEREAKALVMKQKNQAIKEKQEREDYERLRAKYGK